MSVVKNFQKYRTKKLEVVGRFFLKLNLTPNLLTFLSLITGLLAVYFLFNNVWYFIIFTLIHFFFDATDGVTARLSKTSKFGGYFDTFVDNLILFLCLIKLGWFLQDYYAYVIAGLFFLSTLFYFTFRFRSPYITYRTIALILLALFTLPFLPDYYSRILLTIGYLVAGVATVFSLARQLQWVVMGRNSK